MAFKLVSKTTEDRVTDSIVNRQRGGKKIGVSEENIKEKKRERKFCLKLISGIFVCSSVRHCKITRRGTNRRAKVGPADRIRWLGCGCVWNGRRNITGEAAR